MSCAVTPGPTLFNAGHDNQLGLAFSPDGKTAYWAEWNGTWGSSAAGPRAIFSSTLVDSGWSDPALMPFSGEFSDDDPFVSPDGLWLYFVSERPAHENDEQLDGDIWRYGLTGSHSLERLSINSTAAEFSPIATSSGTLYFASARGDGHGQGDLYRATVEDDGFAKPVNLGSAINSPTGEWNLWVSPDETEMIFEASGRSTNISVSGDLYHSRFESGAWTTATPMTSLNSGGSDLMPRLHPDGETLYYTTAAIGGHARIVAAKRSQSGQFGQLR